MINPFFFQEVTKVSNSTKISNFIFKDFLHVNVEKKPLVWYHWESTVEEVSFEWLHMFFINIIIFGGLNGLMGSSYS